MAGSFESEKEIGAALTNLGGVTKTGGTGYGSGSGVGGGYGSGSGVGGGIGGGVSGYGSGSGGGIAVGGSNTNISYGSSGGYESLGSISTKKVDSFTSKYDSNVPLSKGSSFTNVNTTTVRTTTTTNNVLQPGPQSLNPGFQASNIATSNVSNYSSSASQQSSAGQPFNFRAPNQGGTNFSFPNTQSQSSVSSVSKADSLVNFDLFKKIQQTGSEQQLQSNEPPRFQFKSNNPNNRNEF